MVLSDDPDDDPAHPLEPFQPPNVFRVLPSVGPVLIAVIFDSHHCLVPTEVEVGEGEAVYAEHRYLCLWPGQAGVDKE
jgi:hypothetical protein